MVGRAYRSRQCQGLEQQPCNGDCGDYEIDRGASGRVLEARALGYHGNVGVVQYREYHHGDDGSKHSLIQSTIPGLARSKRLWVESDCRCLSGEVTTQIGPRLRRMRRMASRWSSSAFDRGGRSVSSDTSADREQPVCDRHDRGSSWAGLVANSSLRERISSFSQ